MERCLTQELVKWKNRKNRKPLLLCGARQVGKTWLMKDFGARCFENTAYINLDANERMRRVFAQDYDIPRIIAALNAETGIRIEPQKTLIIFDEVQEIPRVISSLKYFCENAPEYAVMVAGSLLGVALHSGVSYPVGKVDLLSLYPMNFREFLAAMGKGELVSMLHERDYSTMQIFRDQFIDWLKRYFYIGGMPEAVADYAKNADFSSVRDIQNALLLLYENDFGKHISGNELERVRMLWDSIPVQLAKENKKFFFGKVKSGARAADYEIALQWLADCGLIHRVYRVSKPALPLKAYKEPNAFKVYVNDVGLLSAAGDLPARTILNGSAIFTEFKGALTEQFVFQQLRADTPFSPYYYSPNEHTEIDFVIQKDGFVVPIEVKAGENLQSRSLKAYHEKWQPAEAIRFSMADYCDQDWLRNYPLWCVNTIVST